MNKVKNILALLITTCLLIGSVIPLQAGELEDVLKEQKNIEKKEQEARKNLKNLTNREEQLKNQIQTLASQIAVAEKDLQAKEVAYSQSEELVAQSEKELQEREEELAHRQEVLRKRVREIYQVGQISYLEILLEAESLSDFITRLEYFNRLVENDQKLLSQISEERERVEEQTRILQEKRDEAAQRRKEAQEAKALLDQKRREHQLALNDNKKAQEDIFEQIAQLEKDAKAIAEKIRQLTAKSSGVVHGTISTYPIPGYYTITSPYGWRTHPITKKRSLHTGTDFSAPTGARVVAAGNGVVILSNWYGAYGNTVIIDHGGGYSTLYAHNSKLGVKVGDKVNAGDVISYVGSTGWSTGPHLHFEVRVNGEPTDPMQFFK
ncbi:MAG: peptidoglycan DD-metalloendopeptidase family protein [Desulfitobacterium sp.]|nr:peptidoglycan DD-metalloendopeptidase family protein [Desulfitobacterium sp.]